MKILFIGAEKSNLQSVKRLIEGLPEVFNFPIFICIPYIKSYKLNFIKYLSNGNNFKIRHPQHTEEPENGIIYIAPPLVHTFIFNDSFYISKEHTRYYSQPSIDLSLISFADNYKQNLYAVVFPSKSKEGIYGMKKLIANNGQVVLCKDFDFQSSCDCNSYIDVIGDENCFDISQIINNITQFIQYAEY